MANLGGLMPSTAYVLGANTPGRVKQWAWAARAHLGNLVQICNGASDDILINLAIASVSALGGGVVRLIGNFSISSYIIMASYIELKGQGKFATTIVTVGDITTAIKMSTIDKFKLSDFEIDASSQTTFSNTHSILELGTITYPTIESLSLHDGSFYGVSLWKCNDSLIEDVEVYDCGDDGIHPNSNNASYNYRNKYIKNYCHDNGAYGIKDNGNSAGTYNLQNEFDGNICYNNTEYGLYIYGQNGAIVTNNHCNHNGKSGIRIDTVSYSTINANVTDDNSQTAPFYYGIMGINVDNSIFEENISCDEQGSPTQQYGIALDSNSSGNIIKDNTTLGNAVLGMSISNTDNIVGDNKGYIHSGEFRTASGSLTGGAANAILFAWHNPEAQDILVTKVVVNITTLDGDAANIDVGIADDATYTNGGIEFFNDLAGETAQVNDSWVVGDGGAQTKWVLCQDSASATDGWVVGKILDADGSNIAGSYYIEYIGK